MVGGIPWFLLTLQLATLFFFLPDLELLDEGGKLAHEEVSLGLVVSLLGVAHVARDAHDTQPVVAAKFV